MSCALQVQRVGETLAVCSSSTRAPLENRSVYFPDSWTSILRRDLGEPKRVGFAAVQWSPERGSDLASATRCTSDRLVCGVVELVLNWESQRPRLTFDKLYPLCASLYLHPCSEKSVLHRARYKTGAFCLLLFLLYRVASLWVSTEDYREEAEVREKEESIINAVLCFSVGYSVFCDEPCLQPRAARGSLWQR